MMLLLSTNLIFIVKTAKNIFIFQPYDRYEFNNIQEICVMYLEVLLNLKHKNMKLIKMAIAASIVGLLMCGCHKEKRTGDANDWERNDTTTQVTVTSENPSTSNHTGLATIIDFSASWCRPCQEISPYVHELAKEFEGKVNFLFIDVDQDPARAEQYGVQAVPTFVVLDANGKETDRVTGADAAELRRVTEDAVKLGSATR